MRYISTDKFQSNKHPVKIFYENDKFIKHLGNKSIMFKYNICKIKSLTSTDVK